MIKLFYAPDGGIAAFEALRKVYTEKELICLFPELQAITADDDENIALTLPAPRADADAALREIIALVDKTQGAALIATCSLFVLHTLQKLYPNVEVIDCSNEDSE